MRRRIDSRLNEREEKGEEISQNHDKGGAVCLHTRGTKEQRQTQIPGSGFGIEARRPRADSTVAYAGPLLGLLGGSSPSVIRYRRPTSLERRAEGRNTREEGA